MRPSSRPTITVVGSLNMDLVVRAPRIPVPGQTVLGGSFATVPGGKGANQAVAAARMGARVHMVGRVGDDAFGTTLLRSIADAGVECSHVTVTPGLSTGVGLIVVEEDTGQNAIVVASGANSALSPLDVGAAEPLIAASDALVLQLETPLETVAEAVRMGVSHGVRIVLNPAPACHLDDALLAMVDVVVPNEIELGLLVGNQVVSEQDAAQAASALLRRGPKAVVTTLGSKGALTVAGAEAWITPPFDVKAVDATASGDAFVGTLAVTLAEGRSLREAVVWANAAGARAATMAGAMPSLPTRESVEELVRSWTRHPEGIAPPGTTVPGPARAQSGMSR